MAGDVVRVADPHQPQVRHDEDQHSQGQPHRAADGRSAPTGEQPPGREYDEAEPERERNTVRDEHRIEDRIEWRSRVGMAADDPPDLDRRGEQLAEIVDGALDPEARMRDQALHVGLAAVVVDPAPERREARILEQCRVAGAGDLTDVATERRGVGHPGVPPGGGEVGVGQHAVEHDVVVRHHPPITDVGADDARRPRPRPRARRRARTTADGPPRR